MSRPNLSTTARHVITVITILAGAGTLFYFESLWPEIILVIGLAIALKQFLGGATFDPIASLIIFGCMYTSIKGDLGWGILIPLPTLIFVVGFFILIHEYFLKKESSDHSMDSDDF